MVNFVLSTMKGVEKMKKNMGSLDKIIRISAAFIIAILYYMGVITGTLAIILLIFAGIFILTSLIGYCPVYSLLGIRTNKATKHNQSSNFN